MPTSASLVTNLPADFNTFGQGVDTSLQDLLGGTTGQVLSKTSGTNMDFTWVTPTDQTPLTTKGDLFAFSTVDARLPAGANETRLVADSAQTLGLKYVADTTNYAIAAKADLLVGTAADTLAPLTVGTNGQVLTADSTVSPTGLKWATPAGGGGMTLLSTTALSGTSTTVSSIDQTYTDLVVYISTLTFSASAELNFTTGGTNNYQVRQQNNTFAYDSAVAKIRTSGSTPLYEGVYMQINRYTDTKTHTGNIAYFDANFGATGNTWFSNFSNAAVTSITIGSQAGTATMSAGSVLIYGVK